ncbi:MAG: hypothetical protein QOD06_1422 [Candidatus Binatota bacterium]|nr:hypothetical protein [Candidatus Binatota bacterium]
MPSAAAGLLLLVGALAATPPLASANDAAPPAVPAIASTPAEHARAAAVQTSPPAEKHRVLQNLHRWRSLPESRRRQLRERHRQIERLRVERPKDHHRLMQNYQRWLEMTPAERQRAQEKVKTLQP